MRFFSIIARRVFYALALLLAVIIFNFILLSMVPGDIAEKPSAGESGGASAEEVDGRDSRELRTGPTVPRAAVCYT